MVGDAGASRLWLRWSALIAATYLVLGAPLALTVRVYDDEWLFDGSFEHDMMLLFHPDAEGGFGAGASAGLMVAAAIWSWRWASAYSLFRGRLFSAALLFLAFDDWVSLHERLESRLGVDWQVLYVPVALVVVLLFLAIDKRLADVRGPARRLWWFGAGCQAAALFLENIQWNGDDEVITGYELTMFVEEILEAMAPALWGLALLTAFFTLLPRAVVPIDRVGPGADVVGGVDLTAESPRVTVTNPVHEESFGILAIRWFEADDR